MEKIEIHTTYWSFILIPIISDNSMGNYFKTHKSITERMDPIVEPIIQPIIQPIVVPEKRPICYFSHIRKLILAVQKDPTALSKLERALPEYIKIFDAEYALYGDRAKKEAFGILLLVAVTYTKNESNLEAVKLLLTTGISVNHQDTCRMKGPCSCRTVLSNVLDNISSNSTIDTLKLILDEGADVNQLVYKHEGKTMTPLLRFLKHKQPADTIEDTLTVINLLLDRGADINAVTEVNQNHCLHYAISHAYRYKTLAVLQLLVERGANYNIIRPETNGYDSILTWACIATAHNNPIWPNAIEYLLSLKDIYIMPDILSIICNYERICDDVVILLVNKGIWTFCPKAQNRFITIQNTRLAEKYTLIYKKN